MIPHLNIFQLIVVPLAAVLFVRSLILLGRGLHRRASALGALVWLAAGVTILRPNITVTIARAMGIGRGTDLVLYFFLMAFLATAFYFYNRVMQLESAITIIVRHAALREACPAAPPIPQEKTADSQGPMPSLSEGVPAATIR
jgi:small membrane protein